MEKSACRKIASRKSVAIAHKYACEIPPYVPIAVATEVRTVRPFQKSYLFLLLSINDTQFSFFPYNNVLFSVLKNVEFCIFKLRFTDSMDFLFFI